MWTLQSPLIPPLLCDHCIASIMSSSKPSHVWLWSTLMTYLIPTHVLALHLTDIPQTSHPVSLSLINHVSFTVITNYNFAFHWSLSTPSLVWLHEEKVMSLSQCSSQWPVHCEQTFVEWLAKWEAFSENPLLLSLYFYVISDCQEQHCRCDVCTFFTFSRALPTKNLLIFA